MLEALTGTFRRSLAVWRRNALVWRKGATASLLGSFVEPLLYVFALGLGLGRFVGEVQGGSYLVFLAAGILASNTMNTATFEGLYLSYTRMQVLRTWDGMLAAPLSITDVVLGEILWMGSKSLVSAGCILAVAALCGLAPHWQALWVLPLALLSGLCFGAMALLVTSFARSYEFFVYYVTLGITPMVLLSGVFFPADAAPASVQQAMAWLPLAHVVNLMRPLMAGDTVTVPTALAHLAVPLAYGLGAAALAVARLRKRLLQ